MATKTELTVDDLVRTVPISLDVMAMRTVEDVISAVRTEMDLIEEGQDGTNPKDLPKLRRWWNKHVTKQLIRRTYGVDDV